MTTKAKDIVEPFSRAFPIDDIVVRADPSPGGGRIVEAYAAVFNRTARLTDFYRIAEEIWFDEYGTYDEIIRNGAFSKTLNEQRPNVQCLYNHGKDIYGVPAERYAMPLGTPTELKQDSKGLWTATRYAKTELCDEVIAHIDNESIRFMSFSGKCIQSTLTRATQDGDVDLIERKEIALKEYGPCLFPAYKDAVILGMRAEDLAEHASRLSDDERSKLIQRLTTTSTPSQPAAPTGTGDQEPPVASPDTSRQAGDQPPAVTGPSIDSMARAQEQRRRRAV